MLKLAPLFSVFMMNTDSKLGSDSSVEFTLQRRLFQSAHYTMPKRCNNYVYVSVFVASSWPANERRRRILRVRFHEAWPETRNDCWYKQNTHKYWLHYLCTSAGTYSNTVRQQTMLFLLCSLNGVTMNENLEKRTWEVQMKNMNVTIFNYNVVIICCLFFVEYNTSNSYLNSVCSNK